MRPPAKLLAAVLLLGAVILPTQAVAGSPWDCIGPPPSPGDGSWEPAFASISDQHPDAIEEARVRAERKLIERLCGTHPDCASLRPAVTPGEVGKGAGVVCAQVFVETLLYNQWLAKRSTDELRAKFRAAAESLLHKTGFGGKSPRVLVDKISDAGAAGGARVEAVLLPKIRLALQDAGAQLALSTTRKRKHGRWPRGVDIIVSGQAIDTMEGRVSVVQVNWSARAKTKRGVLGFMGEPLSVPASLVGPPPKQSFSTLPASTDDLSVLLDSRPGGSLCLGDRTQLRLHSATRMHVRVFDLYGTDGALLLYPNSSHRSGLVKADETIELGGPEGFIALPVPGSEAERFLVLAAPSEELLGPLAAVEGYCRVPHDLALALHRGEGLPPGVRAVSDGFRVVDDPTTCPPAPAPEERAAIEKALASLPLCNIR